MDEPLVVEGLVVKYGEKVAVDGLSFHLRPGEIYGLLGPNGAGKTSTIKAIIGLVEPSSGSVKVYGRGAKDDPVYVKSQVGAVLENPVLFDSLTPNEFFEFVASVRGVRDVDRIRALVEAFDLQAYMETPIAALSLGNKQKVAVVAALLHNPGLLILDEPFNGLDVRAVAIFKDVLLKHIERGGAVLFSTHIMEVAEKICTRVGIIHQGRMVDEGTVDELKLRIHGSSLEEILLKATQLEKDVAEALRGLG
ncbi:MAG: ABC transporter ATP-binding protein [Thermoprotei archaeon]